MNIPNPRRLLALGPPNGGVLTFIKDLTGTAPNPPNDSAVGLSHAWPVKTSYYDAAIPIWIDEIAEAASWSADFLKPEAREVLGVLGAFVFCFRRPLDEAELETVKDCLRAIQTVCTRGCGSRWDGICLAVAMPQSSTPWLQRSFEEWEDLARDYGFEYVDAEMRGRNEFAEPTGMERIKEALEANDWDGGGDDDVVGLGLEDSDEEEGEEGQGKGFDTEAQELQREMLGMHAAVVEPGDLGDDGGEMGGAKEGEEGELQVDQLEAMMLKMQAVRDVSADLSERERRRLAAKTVSEIMKTI